MGVSKDQDTPPVTRKSQAARNRARLIAKIFVVHIKLIVTYLGIDSIVDMKSIVTIDDK
jgi:hypothetical protein